MHIDFNKPAAGMNYEKIIAQMTEQMKTTKNTGLDFQNRILQSMDRIIMSMEKLTNTFEQQVSIQAEFKDTRTSQEIVDALTNLTNRASQAAFNVSRRR